MPEADQTFEYVSEVILRDQRVSESTVFGSPCLAIGHKAFVIFYREDLVVRLRSDRARELIESHEGHKFDPLESGWALEGWVRLAQDNGRNGRLWVSLAEEARDYAVATVDPNELRSASVTVDVGDLQEAPPAENDEAFEEVVLQPTEMRPLPSFALGEQPTEEREVINPSQPTTVHQTPDEVSQATTVHETPEFSQETTISQVVEPEGEAREGLSFEFSLDELEEISARSAADDDGADGHLRSALDKVNDALEARRTTDAVRAELGEAGLDTGHMSDEEVVALGRRISERSFRDESEDAPA